MLNLALGCLTSFCLTLWIVKYTTRAGSRWLDSDLKGVQKMHTVPVPRVGGVAIVGGTGITFIVGGMFDANPPGESLLLLGCAAIPFLAGSVEDVTKRVSPRIRLLAAMAGAICAVYALNAVLGRVDLPIVDRGLALMPVAIGLTVLTVSGLTNAINLIDGMNGLASVSAILIFGSIGFVAHQVGDWLIMSVALTMIGTILGFAVWNYPGAAIFLGDGGAYFIGFLMAELLVLLIARHPNVSAWYAAVVAIYPLFETIFSIYRRKFVRGRPVSEPDGVHLHTLIYRRIALRGADYRDARQRGRRNARTSPYLWALCSVGVVPASLFWNQPVVLFATDIVFVGAYVWFYACIVRFKTPRFLLGHSSITPATSHETRR
ncbi:glycosyl transferase [Caballeronia grimmiae]|jgi:UDP-N-acetylmuramyl pentapeptide phosphotransferase/UDP-N-acetylglucosamine-1-phosphate transferase|uniref:Glycosyl transferase n=2 Tax=Caballeronia grimmiae TaxID=1071679 RepID=A0A069PA98_9BURK|nr:glycosyltransferase [Caballeronia grimmiae]KDR36754.1 glycosyl transferase [Caballeronia grimmiae]GGD77811.1 glycosyl transferase [Caballeronia grimmiae]